MLRQNGRPKSVVSKRTAIDWIHAHYNEPLRVEPLATVTGTSISLLYRYFKAITQNHYQKKPVDALAVRVLFMVERSV